MRLNLLASALIAFAAPDTGRGGDAGHVVEIVTFRLQSTADRDAFAEAAADMSPFLRSTGAVLSRTLSVDEHGLWTDHIVWKNMATARETAARIMQEPSALPFMALIDPGSVDLRHGAIHFEMPPE